MPNFDEEKLIQSLIDLYRQGFLNVLKVILEKETKKQNTVYFKDILKQIIAILEQLDQNAAKWIEENVPKKYQQIYIEVMAFIKQIKGEAIQNPSFSQIHQRAIDVLAQNLYDNLRDATQFVGRKFDDYFRRASLESAGKKYVSGETWQQMKKDLMEKLLTKGLTGFKDKLGREWRLDSYAEMVARTLTREIATTATINACKEFDIDLVKISTHYPTCELCAPIQGKVFSISGRDKRYPKLKEEYKPPIHPNCYSKDTEVYTRNGWKLIKDVQVGEECLSLNPETLEMEFVKVIDTVSYKAEKLIRFYHKHFDMMVTFNHLCLWQNDEARKKYRLNKGWRFIEAQELLDNNSGRFLRVGSWKGKDLKKIKIGNLELTSEQYAKLMGWFLSEGSCDHKLKRIQIAQSRARNPEKWNEIKSLLDELRIKYSYNDERFVIYCGLYDYFRQFGKCDEKFIPQELKDAAPEIIKLFLNAYIQGDGHERKAKKYKGGNFKNERVYFTSSKRMADDLGELILKIGERPSFCFEKNTRKTVKFRNGEYTIKTDIWFIRECNTKTTALETLQKEVVDYNDWVYCLELEKYHTLYVRRNGKCVWSGNCRHVLTPYVRGLDDNAEETQKYSNTSLTTDPRSEKEKQAYKEMRDQRTIQTIRIRAREVLYNENAALEEKVKAAEKLKKSYEKEGKKPTGRDASIIKQYDEYINKNTQFGLITSENANILESKIINYALNKDHPKGKDKATAFEKALGYNINNYKDLIKNIMDNLNNFPAVFKGENQYGKKYEITMKLTGPNGNTAKVKTGWIEEKETGKFRLTTIYVDE